MAADAGLVLANPQAMSAGETIVAVPLQDLAETANWNHAEGGCGSMVTASWASGVMLYTGAKAYATWWEIPVLSSSHVTITLDVYASAVATGGAPVAKVYLRADGEQSEAVVVGDPPAWYSLSTTVDASGDFDVVELGLQATDCNLEILDYAIGFEPLSDPLPDEVAGDIVPADLDGLDEYESLASLFGHALLANTRALEARRGRCVFHWSGAKGFVVPNPLVATAPIFMPERLHVATTRLHRGLATGGVTYTVKARCYGRSSATGIYVLSGDPSAWPNGRDYIEVPGVEAWHDVEAEITLDEERVLGSWPHPSTALGIWPGRGIGRTTARVYSITITGP